MNDENLKTIADPMARPTPAGAHSPVQGHLSVPAEKKSRVMFRDNACGAREPYFFISKLKNIIQVKFLYNKRKRKVKKNNCI